MQSFAEDIKRYYDEHTIHKLKDFVYGNKRVERAWSAMQMNLNCIKPGRILEVGCGIGFLTDRMLTYWPHAEAVGLDISPKSIDIANKVFQSPNCRFVLGELDADSFLPDAHFDLIVMMDVFEHIAKEERSRFCAQLKKLCADKGCLFLSFPTPRHQQYLRTTHPSALQPVDEDITLDTMIKLSAFLDMSVYYYKEISVWNYRDYAHCIIGRNDEWFAISDEYHVAAEKQKEVLKKIKNRFLKNEKQDQVIRQRRQLIKDKLGIQL